MHVRSCDLLRPTVLRSAQKTQGAGAAGAGGRERRRYWAGRRGVSLTAQRFELIASHIPPRFTFITLSIAVFDSPGSAMRARAVTLFVRRCQRDKSAWGGAGVDVLLWFSLKVGERLRVGPSPLLIRCTPWSCAPAATEHCRLRKVSQRSPAVSRRARLHRAAGHPNSWSSQLGRPSVLSFLLFVTHASLASPSSAFHGEHSHSRQHYTSSVRMCARVSSPRSRPLQATRPEAAHGIEFTNATPVVSPAAHNLRPSQPWRASSLCSCCCCASPPGRSAAPAPSFLASHRCHRRRRCRRRRRRRRRCHRRRRRRRPPAQPAPAAAAAPSVRPRLLLRLRQRPGVSARSA